MSKAGSTKKRPSSVLHAEIDSSHDEASTTARFLLPRGSAPRLPTMALQQENSRRQTRESWGVGRWTIYRRDHIWRRPSRTKESGLWRRGQIQGGGDRAHRTERSQARSIENDCDSHHASTQALPGDRTHCRVCRSGREPPRRNLSGIKFYLHRDE